MTLAFQGLIRAAVVAATWYGLGAAGVHAWPQRGAVAAITFLAVLLAPRTRSRPRPGLPAAAGQLHLVVSRLEARGYEPRGCPADCPHARSHAHLRAPDGTIRAVWADPACTA